MCGRILKTVTHLALVFFTLTCSGKQHIQPKPINSGEGSSSILIVTRPSEFKARVVDKLVNRYRNRATLTLIDLKDLDSIQTSDYDALVVMGARMGFLLLSAKERRFLRRLEEPKKLILVMTAAANDWEWDRDDIDVITCASNFRNVQPLYREVIERLDKILKM